MNKVKTYPRINYEESGEKILATIKMIAKDISNDPNTQIACSIKMKDGGSIIGANRIPEGVSITNKRLERPQKYKWIGHAETSAISLSAKLGYSTKNTDIYLPWFPCVNCAQSIINAGIKTLHCYKPNLEDPKWGDDFRISVQMLKESNTNVIYYDEKN